MGAKKYIRTVFCVMNSRSLVECHETTVCDFQVKSAWIFGGMNVLPSVLLSRFKNVASQKVWSHTTESRDLDMAYPKRRES